MIPKELEKTFEFFVDNIDELQKKYKGKYIALKDSAVLGVYNSYEEAIIETKKKYMLGTFLVQRCDKESIKPQNFYSFQIV